MSDFDGLLHKYAIDTERMPQHIAIIMDGNGRWAKKRLMPRNFGHQHGQKKLKETLINCAKLKIKFLSVYVFSTENWRRPKLEVSFLITFLKKSIVDEIEELIKEGVKLKFLGDLSEFDSELLNMIRNAEDKTSANATIQLNVMINYGGRREIIDAVKHYDHKGGNIDQFTEDDLSDHLYTGGSPDPDILIRTGGDIRISNFMLWQCAYSEFFFLDTFWPDFTIDHLLDVIQRFQKRDRRFGGLTE